MPGVVPHAHPLPTDAAHGQALEQGRPFPGRPPRALGSPGVGVRPEPPLIFLELLPGDVAGMRVRDEGGPFLARQALKRPAPRTVPALPAAAEEERAGVPRIVQDREHARMLQLAPQHVALGGAAARPARKPEALGAEVLHGGHRRAGAPEGPEQAVDRLLHLPVGVEDHPCVAGVAEPDRQRSLQLPAPGLVQDPPAQPRAQDVQLGLTHRAL